MTLHDATEYQFATPTWRVLVREARAGEAAVGLGEAARSYAATLRDVLDATGLRIEPAATSLGGAEFVAVAASVPPAAPGAAEQVVRAALMRFGDGPVLELSLTASPDDAGAEGEFRRLVDSARPAGPPDPLAEVARSLAAGPAAGADQPAGPVRLTLGPDYHVPGSFLLESTDESVHYRVEAVPQDEAGTRSALIGTTLGAGAGVGVAVTEDGRPVRYESGIRPRLSPGRRPAAETLTAAEVTRGARTPAPGEVVVEGKVGTTPVRVRLTTTGATPPTAEQGERLIRALNAAR